MSRFLVHTRPVQGPQTHAIVIGAGRYLHLRGGDGPLSDRHDDMGQLTSPPVSARAVAKWLIKSLNYPKKPLANVLLLTSEQSKKPFRNPSTGREMPVAEATIDRIEEALTEWRTLGDRSEDDRLLFFFCGHGMARGTDVTLLAADYGAKPANPLDGAIDFRNVVAAMDLCAAREQLYFVDACRVSSDSLIRAGQHNGRPIFQQDEDAPARATIRRAPVFYSALPGAEAYGRPKASSAYTEALLEGLDGGGADDNDGPWLVTTSRLKEALEFFMTRAAPGLGRVLVPAADDHGRIIIHEPHAAPKGVAVVACDPIEETALAALSCRSGAQVVAARNPAPSEWELPLPPGSYAFVADFPGGEHGQRSEEVYVRPVYRRVGLRAQP